MIRQTARAERTMLATLGLLVLVTAFLVAAVPRLLTIRYDEAVRHHVEQAVPSATQVVVRMETGTIRAQSPVSYDVLLGYQLRQFHNAMPDPLRGVLTGAEYWAATPGGGLLGHPGAKLIVGRSSGVDGHIRYVSGHAPGAGDRTALDIGLPAGAARELGVKVGDLVRTGAPGPITARVTGLYEPRDPRDPYWVTHVELKQVSIVDTPSGGRLVVGTGLVSAEGYHVLHSSFQSTPVRIAWTYRPGTSRITAAGTERLAAAVKQADLAFADISLAGSQLSLDTQFDRLIGEAVRQLRATQTVLSLALSGLLAVALGVIVLAGELLLERLRMALTVMRARGASLRQIAGLSAGISALVALPATVAGYGLAVASVPGPVVGLPVFAALAVAVAAVPLPALVAAWDQRRAGRGERRDLTAARPSPRRLVLEGLLILLALVATYLLRRRGAGAGAAHGVDPLLSTVPVLLGLACGLVTLRAYPYALRLLGRPAGRARSAVPFVGVARASRQNLATALPLTVLLLATAVAGFSATVDASLSRAQRLAAWQITGGDIRLETLGLTDGEVDRLRHLPGVRAAVPAQVVEFSSLRVNGADTAPLTMIGVDLDAYRRLMAGTPLRIPPTPGGPGVPALFSPAAARIVTAGNLSLFARAGRNIPIRDAGTISGFPGQDAAAAFVVVPSTAVVRAGAAITTTLFVRGDADPKALERAVSAARPSTTTYTGVHREMTGSALVELVHSAFGYGALAVDGYAALAILLALVIGERSRAEAVAYLRTLGLSRRQARRLALVEVAPVILAAAVVGWALGLVLPRIVGTALDLRSYAADTPVARFVPDLTSTVLFAGGLLLFAGAAVLADAAVAARRRPAATLRMGEQG